MVVPLAGRNVADALGGRLAVAGDPLVVGDLDLCAPLAPPTTFALAKNYPRHAAELRSQVPGSPQVFLVHRGAIGAPGGPIVHPGDAYTRCLDYECELAVVIGRRARAVSEADALDHVFGYAVVNDVSARDLQRSEPQWLRAKGGPGFAPFGPWVTTADEVPDPQALWQRSWVNGELRQDASTAQMVFSVAEVIAWLSASLTLEAGDVIAMGTPAGVGLGFDPPRFLVPGDVVRMEIERLGAIEQAVVAGGGS